MSILYHCTPSQSSPGVTKGCTESGAQYIFLGASPHNECIYVLDTSKANNIVSLKAFLLQALEYIMTEGDEVEDLMTLVAFIKQEIPEIQGVSSGAIASDYQRLRVESVSRSALRPAISLKLLI